MISYIFKSKPKNIAVTILAAVFALIQFKNLSNYWAMSAGFEYIVPQFISLLPCVLIFIYMITLNKEYKFKNLLFPIAFAILAALSALSVKNCFNEYTFAYISDLMLSFLNLIIRLLLILGSILGVIGSLSNFKKVKLLQWGLIINILTTFILGAFYHKLTFYIGAEWLSPSAYFGELLTGIIPLLFYISILLLTLNKHE